MTYEFKHTGPTQRIGMGDAANDSAGFAILDFFASAVGVRIKEIGAGITAANEAETLQKLGASSTKSVTKNANGSTTAAGVTAADFKIVGGVAKPNTFPALTAAKDLQMQLNRVAKKKGFGTIGVDGALGPGTIALANKVSIAAGGGPTNTLPGVIGNLAGVTAAVAAFADKIGAPPPSSTDRAKAASAGSIAVTSSTGQALNIKPPGASASLSDVFRNMGDTTKIGLGGVALLGGLFAFKKLRKKGGGGGSAPAPLLALPAATSNPRARRRRPRR